VTPVNAAEKQTVFTGAKKITLGTTTGRKINKIDTKCKQRRINQSRKTPISSYTHAYAEFISNGATTGPTI